MAATCVRSQTLLLSKEASKCCLHTTHSGSDWRSLEGLGSGLVPGPIAQKSLPLALRSSVPW